MGVQHSSQYFRSSTLSFGGGVYLLLRPKRVNLSSYAQAT